MKDVVIVDSIRTAVGKAGRGSLNLTRGDDLIAHCIDAILDRNPAVAPEMIEDVIVGSAHQMGEMAGNVARAATLLSNLPVTTAASMVNRFCSSGLQAIANAGLLIGAGQVDAVLAGGCDTTSMHARHGDARPVQSDRLNALRKDGYMNSGVTAENVAERYRITREAQDAYALESQRRYAAAAKAGHISEEIAPIEVTSKRVDPATGATTYQTLTFAEDEGPRPGTTQEDLARLRPAFRSGGTVTAGNSCQLSDGASLTLLMDAGRAERLGLEPMGYFRGFTVAGCEPDEMGVGPVYAVPKLLNRNALSIGDIDLWELNEAFASQVLYCRDTLGIDAEKLNVNGGAIPIGHPYGMTGSRMTGALLRELRRRGGRFGVVTMCIGGGQGAAGLFEAIN